LDVLSLKSESFTQKMNLITRGWGIAILILLLQPSALCLMGRYTIVIDPGHGGEDKGGEGQGGSIENEVVLSIAKRLKYELEARSPEVKVLLTRNKDHFVPIRDRISFANSNDAFLFLSLHTNGGPISSLKGFEVWYYNEGRMGGSRRFGEFIQEELRKILVDRGMKQERFLFLKKLKMPGVLVEIGFITNPLEELRLKDKIFKERIAHALSSAILRYIEEKG
jgi:N-acetylmuramoyl-L-alanine amidase